VLVWDNTTETFDLYLDKSIELTDQSGAGSIGSITDTITIGGGETTYFNGLIDEVMIFNKKILTSTISDIYDNNFYSNHSDYSNCTSWWSMDNPRLGIRMGTKEDIV
jgi:hypothetical protein